MQSRRNIFIIFVSPIMFICYIFNNSKNSYIIKSINAIFDG